MRGSVVPLQCLISYLLWRPNDQCMELLIGGVVAVLLGPVLIGVGARKLRPVYRILREEPLPIRDLRRHDGPVEVQGTARPDDQAPLRGPFTNTPCLACTYAVEEYEGGGGEYGGGGYWKTLVERNGAVAFLIEDETGAVPVDHEVAELHLSEWTYRLKPGEEPPERIERYIRQSEAIERSTGSVDLLLTEVSYGDDQRFVERRLDVGEPVHVYGTVERGPASEWGSNRVDAVLTADEETPLVVSDSAERGTAWQLAKPALVPFLAGILGLVVGVGLVLAAVGLTL